MKHVIVTKTEKSGRGTAVFCSTVCDKPLYLWNIKITQKTFLIGRQNFALIKFFKQKKIN